MDTDQSEFNGGTAVATAPPRVAVTDRLNVAANPTVPQRQISIRHQSGDRIVAMIELISPGNKDKVAAVEQFVDNAAVYFEQGMHLLINDLFRPANRDLLGVHSMIWTRLGGDPFTPPPGKPLTLFAHNAGAATCYVEPTAVGTALIEMPLFLTPERYVNVPLEETYMAAYEGVPRRWKQVIELVI